MTEEVQKPTVTFNDKVYDLEGLPQEVKDLINIHQMWNTELVEQRRNVFKTEAAMRSVLNELETRFKQVDTDAAPVAEVAPAVEVPAEVALV
jgi:hypothetical protein